MNYIWEAVLSAKNNGIYETDLRYRQAQIKSPYMEVSFFDLNALRVEENEIEVNPFYRFSDIFCKILDINNLEYEQTRELFFDAVFHYLAHTDLRMGMSKKEFYYQFLLGELQDGKFGTKAQAAIQLFSQHERKYIILALMDLARSGNHIEIFKWLLREIYRDSIIYVSMDCANELFIYVGKQETPEEVERIGFLMDTFLPIGERTEVFYAEHFGILDVEETMILDRILLI